MNFQKVFDNNIDTYDWRICLSVLNHHPDVVDPSSRNNKAWCIACENNYASLVYSLIQDKRVDVYADNWYGLKWALVLGYFKVLKVVAEWRGVSVLYLSKLIIQHNWNFNGCRHAVYNLAHHKLPSNFLEWVIT